MSKRSAFTIVELLVVMAVIGVLLSLAVFGIQALQKSQRETQRLNDLRNIQGALESYFAKYSRYPLSGEVTVEYNFAFLNNPTQSFTPTLLNTAYAAAGVIPVGPAGILSFIIKNESTTFATIPIQSLKPLMINSPYTTEPCSSVTAATADNWFVSYSVSNGSPQKFGLFGCTETGKTKNFGSRDI